MENLSNIIESLLFVADEPLSVAKLRAVLETADTNEIKTALHSLADRYEARGGGFGLSEVAGGWQLRTRPEYHDWIKRLLQPSPQRLSKAALETLAIVAYNQPIIRADVEHIRGVDCGGILRQLLERKLIRVLGRKEIPGRPLIYATSKLFLELFDLKDLKDLPTPREIEEMSATDDAASNQRIDTDTASLLEEASEGTTDAVDGLMDDSTLFDLDTLLPAEHRASGPSVAPNAMVWGGRQRLKVKPQSGIVMAAHPIPDAKAAISATAPAISTPANKAPTLSIRISGVTKARCSQKHNNCKRHQY
jgi:segregation and condensation protein B